MITTVRRRRLDRYGGRAGAAGEPDGNFLALDAETGQELFRFQTGFGADAPPVVYEVDGEQFITIATGGNQMQGSAYGDAVWTFSLNGKLGPRGAAACAAHGGRPNRTDRGRCQRDQDRRQ